ncbi:MAG: hypothetical protein EBY16_07525 [Gammaproteobacteria bacterium]|nr:hypothetical protein [Gammaproteobacteria bacterium]
MLAYLPYIAEGILINRMFYYIEEIKAGQTTNKIYLYLKQSIMNHFCIAVILEIFPNNFSYLNSIVNILVASANYLSYVYETNQIQEGSKKTLPFGLEKNVTLKNIAQFISQYSNWIGAASYIAAIGFAAFYLTPYMVVGNLLGFILEQMYQRNLFPPILASIYRIISVGIFSGLVFGFDNWITISLSFITITFNLADHVLTHQLGITTASAQFPISRKSNTFSFEESGISKPQNKADLEKMLARIKDQPVALTFDHMRQSALLIEQMSQLAISQSAEAVDYDLFITLFEQIDLEDKALRATIEAEITQNDDFLKKEREENPEGLNQYERIRAYLKAEILEMVKRLKSNEPRALSPDRVAILKGQAGLILAHLEKLGNKHPQFSATLLRLALSTGHHCSRMYLECFADIITNNGLIYKSTTLSLKERVLVRTQDIKSEEFRKCYYKIMGHAKKLPQLLDVVDNGGNFYSLLQPDSTDFHSYENFVLAYGPNFYLNNSSYSIRFRGLKDIILDMNRSLLPVRFADFYNHDLLIKEVIEGKLSADFVQWCQSFYPNAYQDMCLDEDSWFDKNNPNLKALATLMLLDCNIIQFKTPFSLDAEKEVHPGCYERFCASYHQFFDEFDSHDSDSREFKNAVKGC